MSLWSRLSRGFRRKPSAEPEPGPTPDDRLRVSLSRVREKLSRLLITRSRPQGEIKRTKRYALVKNNPGLFRLETENLSVLISTESFLYQKDGKVQGLLQMSELALCRALAGESIEEFFRRAQPPGESSRALYTSLLGDRQADDYDRLPALGELVAWPPFDMDQMIAKSSLNTLAHALVHAPEDLERALVARFSRRLKLELADELERLALPGSAPELNPHSRVRSLSDFEPALIEFRRTMYSYRLRETARRERAASRG